MRLSTTMSLSLSGFQAQLYPIILRSAKRVSQDEGSTLTAHDPEREHGDADGNELQQHAQPHQLLRRVGRAAPHHVDETHQQNERDRADSDGKDDLAQESSHCRYITPACALRHRNGSPFAPTIWLFRA